MAIMSVDDWREEFRGKDVAYLIARFNGGVGNRGWVSSRATFLFALREALLATDLDCSAFISPNEMSLARRIERRDDRLVPIDM